MNGRGMTIICVLGIILIAHGDGDRYLIIVENFSMVLDTIFTYSQILKQFISDKSAKATDLIHDSPIAEILFNER